MTKRMVSWGVTLFSFAMILLAYKPADDGWSWRFDRTYHVLIVTMPNLGYWIVGGIAVILSLFLVISGFWGKWSNRLEEFIIERVDFPSFFIYWFVFIVGYLKGVASLVSSSQPNWLVESLSYCGVVLFFVIPAHYFKWSFARRKQRRISASAISK